MTGNAIRLTLDCTRAELARLEAEWRKHRKVCWTCLTLTAARSRYCGTGWQLAKDIRAARQIVDQLTPEPPPEGGTLF